MIAETGKMTDLSKMVKCEYHNEIFYVSKESLAKAVMDTKIPQVKYVRYKTGAEMYSMSERQFMDVAKDANAVIKLNRMVLVDTNAIDNYLSCFKI